MNHISRLFKRKKVEVDGEELLRLKKAELCGFFAKKCKGHEEFRSKYYILYQITQEANDSYFNLLSESAKNSFLCGEPNLTDIFDTIQKISKGKDGEKLKKLLDANITKIADFLVSRCDVEIFYNTISEFVDNLNEEKKNDILEYLSKILSEKRKGCPVLSEEEKKVLYPLVKGSSYRHMERKIGTSKEFKMKYYVLQDIMKLSNCFDLLSESAKNSFLCGKPNLTDIFDTIQKISKEEDGEKLKKLLGEVCTNIGIILDSLGSKYDVIMFFNMIFPLVNDLGERIKKIILDSSREYFSKKRYSDLSEKERNKLYSLAKGGPVNYYFIEQSHEESLKLKRIGIIRQYITGKGGSEGFDRRYYVFQQIMESDYYFNLLSESAKNSFLCGKSNLTDILEEILHTASQEERSNEKAETHLSKVLDYIKNISRSLTTEYDAEIFYNILSGFANNLSIERKKEVLDSLKKRCKKSKLANLSIKQKDALHSLDAEKGVVNFLFESSVFPLLDAKELFLSFQSGTQIMRSLNFTESKNEKDLEEATEKKEKSEEEIRSDARGKILSSAKQIKSKADLLNMFFKITSGIEAVYFDKNSENDHFQVRKVFSDDIVLEETVVRKSRYNQSSLFGILLVQAILKDEMSLEESEDMKNLFRAMITNLFDMAKKGYVKCLEYIIPLLYDVNIDGLEDKPLNISEIDGEDISNLGGIGKITVLKLAKAYFNGEGEVIEKLEYLERIHKKYESKGITAAMYVAIGKEEPDKLSEENDDDDEKDEKCASTKGSGDLLKENDYTNSDTMLTIKLKYSASSGEEDVFDDEFCSPSPCPKSSLFYDGGSSKERIADKVEYEIVEVMNQRTDVVDESNKEERLMVSSSSSAVVKERTEKRESAEKSRWPKRAEEIGEDRKKKDMCNIQ